MGTGTDPRPLPPEPDPVVIVDHDPVWLGLFAAEARSLRAALGDVAVRIDHIGSTAVLGLAAKPVVDVQVSVDGFEPEARFDRPLATLGFKLLEDPEASEHRFYRRPDERPRRLNIHVCTSGSDWEWRHILLRDYLRANAEAADEYARAKRAAAERFSENRYEYTDAKEPVILTLEQRAQMWARATGWTLPPSDA
jgi:GrpB-like predicted nucleotidyltransferase (UPF0157 family)